MIKFGSEPFLECSSKGDKRFSAFYAKIKNRDNKTIEQIYQEEKVFIINGKMTKNLTTKEAKGKYPINYVAVSRLYSELWDEYFSENLELLDVISKYNGFSDIFGKENQNNQAREIYRIWKMTTSDFKKLGNAVKHFKDTIYGMFK